MRYLLRRAILNLGIFFLRPLYKTIVRLKIGARKIPYRKATIAQGIVYCTFRFVKFMSVNQRISLCGHQLYYPSPTPAIIVLEGEYEVGTTRLFRALLREGMTVIDVGSNVGYFTLLAAKLVGSSGQVFSFEPEPQNFKFLLKNVEVNGYHNVGCVQKAVCNRSGEVGLFLNEEIGSHTLYGSSRDPSITVPTITLDDFLRERGWPSVNLIKMDIEGAELDALEGMTQLLKTQDVRIIIEFSLDRLASADKGADGLLDKLAQLGLRVQIIGEKEGLKPFDMAEIVKRSEQSRVSGVNLLCTLEGR